MMRASLLLPIWLLIAVCALKSMDVSPESLEKCEMRLVCKQQYTDYECANGIAFFDENHIFIGQNPKSYIINYLNHAIWKIDLSATRIASYPLHNLMVVTDDYKVGVYKIFHEKGMPVISRLWEKVKKKSFYTDRSFLICQGNRLVACQKNKVKIYDWKNDALVSKIKLDNGRVGAVCVQQYSLLGDTFICADYLNYGNHVKLQTVQVSSEKKEKKSCQNYLILLLMLLR